jgi:CRISPR-associated protein Cas1
LVDVDSVVVASWAKITTPLMVDLLERGISVHYLKPSGRYVGSVTPASNRGWENRLAQYESLRDEARQMSLVKGIVIGKIMAQRGVLKRAFYRGKDRDGLLVQASRELKNMSLASAKVPSVEALRGIEGRAAAVYFGVWPLLLRSPWRFYGRNRRPPRDPVNAMLSFGYTLLVGTIHNAVISAGLDPMIGYLHPPFRNRSSLVLDLMEEFRPSVVDRAVIGLCNRGDLQPGWFQVDHDGVAMIAPARRRLISALEDRLDTSIKDRGSGVTTTFRRHAEHQARRWASALKTGSSYMPMVLG